MGNGCRASLYPAPSRSTGHRGRLLWRSTVWSSWWAPVPNRGNWQHGLRWSRRNSYHAPTERGSDNTARTRGDFGGVRHSTYLFRPPVVSLSPVPDSTKHDHTDTPQESVQIQEFPRSRLTT